MSTEFWIIAIPFILTALSVGLFFGLLYLYKWLKGTLQGYPNEEQIEAALLPFIYKAIMAAYKASEAFVDAGQDRLRGVDKKKVAAIVYGLLPSSIIVGKYTVNLAWIRLVITQAQFERLIQGAFDGFLAWYESIEEKFSERVTDAIGKV